MAAKLITVKGRVFEDVHYSTVNRQFYAFEDTGGARTRVKTFISQRFDAITFLPDSGATPDADFSIESLAAGSGHQSAQYDLGSAVKQYIYEWRGWWVGSTGLLFDDEVQWYLKTGSATVEDNDEGTSDVALSDTDKLLNLQFIGSTSCDEQTAATVTFGASGILESLPRYIQIVAYNTGTAALSSTVGDHGFTLTPILFQAQN